MDSYPSWRLVNRRTLLHGVVVAAVAVAAGCSTGEGVDLSTGSALVGNPVEGPTLSIAIGGEPDQLDPHSSSAYFTFQVLENVFDTLVEPDENLDMRPALARSWDISEDQLTYTFHLETDVTWQDGSPFTARDVQYSYNRIIDEELQGAWRLERIADIAAPDDHTVVITVSEPTPSLLSNLGGYKGMAIVQQENVESGDIQRSPIGTGPYFVSEYSSGDRIVLRGNADYWRGAPELGRIEVRFISEPSTALAALRSGEVQWTDVVPPHQVEELERDDALVLETIPSSDYWYLALNEAREPWSDVRARQAIAYAIDRDSILQAVAYGTAQANQLAIPQDSVWYTSYDRYSTDIDRARELLDQAGFAGGTLDMLATSDYPETVIAAQVIAANLEPLGITVQIRQPDFSTWLDEQNSGNFDMLMMSWLGNIDPDDYYYSQHHSDGDSNAQGYSNPEVDRLLDAGRVEIDEAARKDLYGQAATIIADEASYIYLYNPALIQTWLPELSGYTARPDGAIRFATASVTE